MSQDYKQLAEKIVEAWRKSWPAEGVYNDFVKDGKFRMTYSPQASLSEAIAQAIQSAVENDRKSRKDRCPCGGIILADTEDLRVPLCCNCYDATIAIEDKWRNHER